MSEVGIGFEGRPDALLRKLDNGFVIPDASVSELHEYHQDAVQNQIDHAIAAERAGFDYVLFPEHHFAMTGAISSNPLQSQMAVAQATEEVRLLQLSNILPWNDPVRLAEQVGALDVVSDGRVDVGVGRGSSALEGETLGQYWGGGFGDQTKNRRSFQEKYELLLSAWTEDLVSFHGEFHDVPPSHTEWENDLEYHYLSDDVSEYEPEDYMEVAVGTTTAKSLMVSPQPVQEPHPQMWRPVASSRSIEWSAYEGVNPVTVPTDFSEAAEQIQEYYDAAAEAGWPDRRPEFDGEPFRYGWDEERRRGFAFVIPVFNTEIADDDLIRRWDLSSEFSLSMAHGQSSQPTDPSEIDAEEMHAGDTPITGGSEEIIDQIATFREECGYEDFMFIIHATNHGMTYEEGREQFRTFADEVLPYFREE